MCTARSRLRKGISARVLLAVGWAAAVVGAAPSLSAGLVRWTGAGGSDLWSDASNWQGGIVPTDGDDVEFGPGARAQARLNFSLQLNSFTYNASATPTAIHVGAGTASTLTFTGSGIVNNTPFVSGQGPQNFFADASSGPSDGTLLFKNTASVMGSVSTTLTASGATVAGGGGGRIIFQDHSSTAITRNFNGLIAAGATVAGAGGGTVILRDEAFKRAAVAQWQSGVPASRVAEGLGTTTESLRAWRRQFAGVPAESVAAAEGKLPAVAPSAQELAAEVRRLRAQLQSVTNQRDILKKAVGIFAGPNGSVSA